MIGVPKAVYPWGLMPRASRSMPMPGFSILVPAAVRPAASSLAMAGFSFANPVWCARCTWRTVMTLLNTKQNTTLHYNTTGNKRKERDIQGHWHP